MPRMNEKLQKREACFRSSVKMLAVKWHDKKDVFMILTMHTQEFVNVPRRYRKQKIVQKPTCVHDYKLMSAVDKTDGKHYSINSQNNKMVQKIFLLYD